MSEKKQEVCESLINAVKEGVWETVEKLVRRYGLSHCEGWHGGYVLLCDAINSHRKYIAKFLLKNDAKVNCDTDYVDTPLHLAIKQGWIEIVGLLLERGARVDAQNGQKETALHLAAEAGYEGIVEDLLQRNASLTMLTTEDSTPLFLAAEYRCDYVVERLLEHARATFQDETNDMPSACPPKKGNSTLLNQILLCNANACDKTNKLVVDIVTTDERYCKMLENINIVDELIDHGFILGQEYINRSLLLAAVANNHFKLVEYILRNGAKPKDADYNPLLPHAAVENERKNIVEVIRNAGLDPDAKDIDAKHYLLLLNTAAENWCMEIVTLLLNPGNNVRDDEGFLCVEEDKCIETIRLLMANGADVKEAPHLLLGVVWIGLVEVCKLLIESGVDVNAENKYGKTALHESCGYARTEEIRQKKDEIVKLLLNEGADVSIKGHWGYTAFHTAASSGRKEAVKAILEFGVNVDLRAEDGSTPLHVASREGSADIVTILLGNKADVDARRTDGSTSLLVGSNSQIVDILLKNGANIDAHRVDGSTRLHFTSDVGIVEALCKNKANVDARRKDGLTPLLLCATSLGKCVKIPTNKVKMLIKSEADVNARGSENKTALHYIFSVTNDYWWDETNEVVTSLLDSGCDINAESDDGKTPLELAISQYKWVMLLSSPSEHLHANKRLENLIRHLIKLKAARLYISEKNSRLISDLGGIEDQRMDYLKEFVCDELPDFQQDCEEEVKRLKNEQVDPSCTLYDALVNGTSPSYARNKSLILSLKSVDCVDFPYYGSLISGTAQRSESRLRLLNSGQKRLSLLMKTSNKLNGNKCSLLPTEVLEEIVSYLRNIDLNNLIASGEALKRQLKY